MCLEGLEKGNDFVLEAQSPFLKQHINVVLIKGSLLWTFRNVLLSIALAKGPEGSKVRVVFICKKAEIFVSVNARVVKTEKCRKGRRGSVPLLV